MTVGNVLITVVNIILGLAVARYLIPIEYGKFIYFVNVFGVLRLFFALGLTSLVTYETARSRAGIEHGVDNFSPLFVTRVFSLAVLLLTVVTTGIWIKDDLLIVAALTASIALMMDFGLGTLQGMALLPQTISVMVLQPVLFGVGVFLTLYFGAPVQFLYAAFLSSFILGLGITVIWIQPHITFRWPAKIVWRDFALLTIRHAGAFYIVGIFLTMFTTFATLILGVLGHYQDTAAFTIPLNLVFMVPAIFSFAMTTVFFPRLVHLETLGERLAAREQLLNFLRYSGILTIFMTVCVMAYPTIILNLLYGDLYLSSAHYLVLMAPIITLATLGTNFLWAHAAEGRIRAALPGIAVPVVFMMIALVATNMRFSETAPLLTGFSIVHTLTAVSILIWQYSLIGYSTRDVWIRIGVYALISVAAVGIVRLLLPDDVNNTALIIAVLGLISLAYLTLVVKKEFVPASLSRHQKKSVLLLFVTILTVTWLQSALSVNAQREDVRVEVFSPSEISLQDLAAGGVGEAWILYYSSNSDPAQPRLVVHLKRQAKESPSVALIYGAPQSGNYVPIVLDIESRTIDLGAAKPQIQMLAPDGWWMRGGIVNYNLDIAVFGQVQAMWGATLDAKSGPQSTWPLMLTPDEPNAQILVRDTNSDGLPDWDWRTMLPEFANRGDLRTNYSERKCDSPVNIDLGISPEWPYIASEGGFEQETGTFRPPIVVDWATGQVKYLSEMVTVRNQNCSYSFYSIQRVLPRQLNSPNFETPFAFYDLSGKGVGYPNLLLRTQRTIEDEPLLRMDNPETQSIRYSWRNAVGDWEWDYKVDVLGQYRYDFQTPIAGGAALIDAPPYEALPDWVIDRDWPVASFVASENTRYRSSEGIYEWSVLGLTDDYLFGWQKEPDLSQFEDIRIGLRGEYRLTSVQQPETYFSSIDNRLHLKWAEHGIWRLDEEHIIRMTNLDGDESIDVWSREAMTATVDMFGLPLDKGAEGDSAAAEPDVMENLYALYGYLLHTDGANLTLVASDHKPALFETLPPTDHDTWEAHRAQLAPYEAQRRDPTNLRSWLDAFPGPRSEIAGASLSNVRITTDGFRFELALQPGYQTAGPDLLGLDGLASGQYVIENQGSAFTVTPLIPAQLSLSLRQSADGGTASPAQFTIHNTGAADAPGLTLVVEIVDSDGATIELVRKPVDGLAGEVAQVLIDIPSTVGNNAGLGARLEDGAGQVLAELEPTPLAGAQAVSSGAIFGIGQVPILLPVVGLFAAFLALAALLAVSRRRGQTT